MPITVAIGGIIEVDSANAANVSHNSMGIAPALEVDAAVRVVVGKPGPFPTSKRTIDLSI